MPKRKTIRKKPLKYDTAKNLPLSQFGVQIAFAKVKAQIETETIKTGDAILQLEKIRHLVASTDLEIPLLQTLSVLYNENNDIVHALYTERQMLSVTQDDAILKQMQRHFEYYFKGDRKHIERVALYNEFKELMPTGIKAISIKQQLLDDFIALDLLDNAYDLAMELAQTTKGATQQKSAVYAYLTATLINDTAKQENALQYLNDGWKEQSFINKMPPVLLWAYKKIK